MLNQECFFVLHNLCEGLHCELISSQTGIIEVSQMRNAQRRRGKWPFALLGAFPISIPDGREFASPKAVGHKSFIYTWETLKTLFAASDQEGEKKSTSESAHTLQHPTYVCTKMQQGRQRIDRPKKKIIFFLNKHTRTAFYSHLLLVCVQKRSVVFFTPRTHLPKKKRFLFELHLSGKHFWRGLLSLSLLFSYLQIFSPWMFRSVEFLFFLPFFLPSFCCYEKKKIHWRVEEEENWEAFCLSVSVSLSLTLGNNRSRKFFRLLAKFLLPSLPCHVFEKKQEQSVAKLFCKCELQPQIKDFFFAKQTMIEVPL